MQTAEHVIEHVWLPAPLYVHVDNFKGKKNNKLKELKK